MYHVCPYNAVKIYESSVKRFLIFSSLAAGFYCIVHQDARSLLLICLFQHSLLLHKKLCKHLVPYFSFLLMEEFHIKSKVLCFRMSIVPKYP